MWFRCGNLIFSIALVWYWSKSEDQVSERGKGIIQSNYMRLAIKRAVCVMWLAGGAWLCPKSLTTPYIVHYIVTTPFCSAVRMSSGKYHTLYNALKVSHSASRKVVYGHLPSNIYHYALRCGRMHGGFVINGAGVGSESAFFLLLLSSLYSPPCWTPYVVTRE